MPLNLSRIYKARTSPLLVSEPRRDQPSPDTTESRLTEGFLAARYEWAAPLRPKVRDSLAAGRDPVWLLDWRRLQGIYMHHLSPTLTEQIRASGAEELDEQLTVYVTTPERERLVLEQARQARERANLAFASGAGGGRGGQAVAPLSPSAPSPRRFTLDARLDLVNPYAVQYAATHVLDLAGRVTNQAKDSIRETVRRSMQGEMDVEAAARQIFEVLGLHPRWANAVRNYEAGLLRKGMAAEVVAGKVSRYAGQLRRKRATMVARTEIMRASNYGRLASWEALGGMGFVDLNRAKKQWSVGTAFAPGEGKKYGHNVTGPCKVCAPMEGKEVGMREKFTLPDYRQLAAPPGHPHCRCVVLMTPPEVAEY